MPDDFLFTHDPRRAGLVRRYHAQPHLITQSVGEHTWQLLRIMTTIWPDVPRSLIVYAIYHDIAEGCTGDLPYTVKLSHPGVKASMDAAEDFAVMNMQRAWDLPRVREPDAGEKAFVKACELVEFAEYSWNERAMGNRYIEVVLQRVLPRIDAVQLAPTFVNTRYHEYVKRRRTYEEGNI